MQAEPIKVLFAIGGLGRGGSERQLVRLVATAHPGRIDATVLTFSTTCDPGHAETLAALGVELIQQGPSGGPRALRPFFSIPRTYRVLRRVRPDVIYAWLEEASTTVTPAASALGIPVVVARRSVCGSEAERQALFRIPIRWAERRARIVTGNSAAVIEEAKARGVRPERLRLARNGHPPVDPLPLPAGETVRLGYVANYRPEKGHGRLLEALELVEARTPWAVDMAGAGDRAALEAEIAARGLSEKVSADGPTTDIEGFWADRDVAVLLSDDEGSPNALIEAAALGRPLVGTDAGGTAEIVSPDGGLLVSHDPGEIAAALERLIDNAGLRRKLGEGAHRHAMGIHDVGRFVDAHLRAVEEAARR